MARIASVCGLLAARPACSEASEGMALLSTSAQHLERQATLSDSAVEQVVSSDSSAEGSQAGSELSHFDWPLTWLHVPKTGGAISTMLAYAGCEELERVPTDGGLPRLPEPCKESGRFERFANGHEPLDPKTSIPHVVTMLREPSERLVSGFYHNFHDCPWLLAELAPGCRENSLGAPECEPLADATPQLLESYAECAGQCYLRMLSGKSCGSGRHEDWEVDQGELDEALAIVGDMGFVGLTEEFSLSVCLWHARFGGDCYESEFAVRRPGPHGDNSDKVALFEFGEKWYSETAMFTDKTLERLEVDTRLYANAKARFWHEVAETELTKDRCSLLCPTHPQDAFATAPASVEEARSRAEESWRQKNRVETLVKRGRF